MDARMKKVLFFVVCFLMLTVFTGIAYSGSVSGTVIDETSSPIPNAEVNLMTMPCDMSTVSGLLPGDVLSHYQFTVEYVTAYPATNQIDVDVAYSDPVAGIVKTTYTVSNGTSFELWTAYNGYLNLTLIDYDDVTDASDISVVFCWQSRTAADGTFTIPEISDGLYSLNVSASGYQWTMFGPFEIDNSDPLKTDRTIPFPIVLFSTGGGGGGGTANNGSISGHVQDVSGNDIAGATVTARIGSLIINTTTTDASGNFNVSVNQSGTYTIDVSASGYMPGSWSGISIDLTQPSRTHVILPSSIVLYPASSTTYLYGYVYNSTGDAIVSANVSTGYGYSITDTNGFYNVSGIPVGVMFDVTVTASGYTDSGITNLLLMAPMRYDFTLWASGSPVTYGNIEGYVKDTTGDPISGATVNCDTVSNTTNASGYYILYNVPSGMQTVTATRSGYDPDTETVTVVAGTTVELNLTLTASSGGGSGGGGTGGTGGTTGGTGSTTPSQQTTQEAVSTSSQFTVNGCNIYVQRTVEFSNGATTITLELVSDCDTEGFELREYPPEDTTSQDLRFVDNAPDEILSDPITLVWRFEEGLKTDEKQTMTYEISEETDPDVYYARIYPLTYQGVAVVPTLVLSAPRYAYIGDNVTLLLSTGDGRPVSNREITVSPPNDRTFTVATDEEGIAVFNPSVIGTYSFSVEGAVLSSAVIVEVVERPGPITPSKTVIVETPEEPKTEEQTGLLNMLMMFPGILVDNLPLIVIGIVALAVISVITYVTTVHLKHGQDNQNQAKERGLEHGDSDDGYKPDSFGERAMVFESHGVRAKATAAKKKSASDKKRENRKTGRRRRGRPRKTKR